MRIGHKRYRWTHQARMVWDGIFGVGILALLLVEVYGLAYFIH